jgi:hypothetical protein
LADKLVQISDVFDKYEQRCNRLERDLYRAQADLEQLRIRVIKGEMIEDDRKQVLDLPWPRKEKQIN